MKNVITILLLMTTTSLMAQDGKATTIKKTFSRETSIQQSVDAAPAIVWALLTHAEDFARWNSTVVSLTGNITEGEKVQLVSTLDPSRTFKLKVKEMVPEQKLVWGDMLGKRTYRLENQADGKTHFRMSEKIGGLMFPLFASKIPSFDESFEQFVVDLKREAERIQQTH